MGTALARSTVVGATDRLEDFLEGAGAGSAAGERLETIGLAIALPSIVVAVGLIAFILFVHKQGSPGDRLLLRHALAVCGLLALVGGLVEIIGTVTVSGGTWLSDLSTTTRAPLARLSAGVLMTVGFLAISPRDAERWRVTGRTTFGVIGATFGALSFASDGHTVTEGNQVIHAALDVVHVLTAGVWMGGVVGLFLMLWRRRRRRETNSLAPTVVRFSTVATLAIVSVAAAGVGMSFLIVDSIGDYFTTEWGRWLLVKVGLVVGAAAIGAHNHYVVTPALETDPSDAKMLSRVRTTISAEMVLLLVVTVVTVFLAEASVDQ